MAWYRWEKATGERDYCPTCGGQIIVCKKNGLIFSDACPRCQYQINYSADPDLPKFDDFRQYYLGEQ